MFGIDPSDRKGGIPKIKLRGVNEADFFQKNNRYDKGFTFRQDGSLVEFKQPKLQKDLDEKVSYEVSGQAFVRQALFSKSKNK